MSKFMSNATSKFGRKVFARFLSFIIVCMLVGAVTIMVEKFEVKNKFKCDCFLAGAFINKRARLLQSLVFFLFFKDTLEATNVNVQLKETTKPDGNKGSPLLSFFPAQCNFFRNFFLSPKSPPLVFYFLNIA